MARTRRTHNGSDLAWVELSVDVLQESLGDALAKWVLALAYRDGEEHMPER